MSQINSFSFTKPYLPLLSLPVFYLSEGRLCLCFLYSPVMEILKVYHCPSWRRGLSRLRRVVPPSRSLTDKEGGRMWCTPRPGRCRGRVAGGGWCRWGRSLEVAVWICWRGRWVFLALLLLLPRSSEVGGAHYLERAFLGTGEVFVGGSWYRQVRGWLEDERCGGEGTEKTLRLGASVVSKDLSIYMVEGGLVKHFFYG